HPPAVRSQQLGGGAQELAAVDAAILRIGIGKVLSDVAEGSRADQRVAYRVQQHIGVGMPVEAPVVRDGHPADHEHASRLERMRVKTLSDTEVHLLVASVSIKSAASCKSSGYVTLRLRASPRTSLALFPNRSTACASSVISAGSLALSASSSNRYRNICGVWA